MPGSSVIDWRSIYRVLGAFLGVLALCMLLPLGYDLLALHQVSMAFVDAVAQGGVLVFAKEFSGL